MNIIRNQSAQQYKKSYRKLIKKKTFDEKEPNNNKIKSNMKFNIKSWIFLFYKSFY